MKIVKAGNVVEVYRYAIWKFYDFAVYKRSFNGKQDIKSRSSFSKTRASFFIRGLVNANPSLKIFLTLTFKENIQDVAVANALFTKFIQKVKYSFGKFDYVCVIEFQKRGAIHYHLVWSLPFIEKNVIARVWGHGFVKLKEVNSVRNLGAYFSKHGTKDFSQDETIRLAGQKKYFTSRGLVKPLVFRDRKRTARYFEQNLKGLEPFFSNEYGEEESKIIYNQFILKK